MRQTLFYLPATLFGIPLFGFGILFWAVLLFTVIVIVVRVRKHGMDEEAWGYLPMLIIVEALIVYVVPSVSTAEGFPIRGFGTFMLFAIVASVGLLMYRGKKLWNIPPDTIISLALWCVICGLLGARLFYVIQYWSKVRQDDFIATIISIVSISEGGLVVYGSIIGGTLGATVFLLKNKLPVLATLDLLAPALLLGIAIGRLGCLMNGCCFGGVCDLPWAVTFPPGSPAHYHQLHHQQTYFADLKFREERLRIRIDDVRPGSEAEKRGLKKDMTILALGQKDQLLSVKENRALFDFIEHTIHERMQEIRIVTDSPSPSHEYRLPLTPQEEVLSVHPTQVYSSLSAAFGCGLLLFLARRCQKDGQVFLLLMIYYPITRFILEMIRTDEASFFETGLTISQNVSLLTLGGAVLFGFYLARRSTKRAYQGKYEKS